MAGARRGITDLRGGRRHPVDYRVVCEQRGRGEVDLHIVNISPSGFMVEGETGLHKGGRLTVPLPAVGRVDAFLVWRSGGRAGFQIERLLRDDEFAGLLKALRTSPT